MLKGIPIEISPELLYVLAKMGHGDYIVIADEFYPADSMTLSGRVIYAKGMDSVEVINAITELMPIDTEFTEFPVLYMAEDNSKEKDLKLEVHSKVLEKLKDKKISEKSCKPINRMEFYEIAKYAYATVSTSEERPYGCFILKKGI